jgi:hypothetical protein
LDEPLPLLTLPPIETFPLKFALPFTSSVYWGVVVTDANVCAGGCIIPAADATQHKSVTLTDQGVSADGCGIPEAVDTSAAVGTDARKERASRVGKERHLG